MMFEGIPFIGFFLSLIWFTGIAIIVFIVLNLVRNVLTKGMKFALRIYEFFLGLIDVISIMIWLFIIATLISYLLLETSFNEMFRTIFTDFLPAYIVLISFKFCAYNLSNRTEVSEFA